VTELQQKQNFNAAWLKIIQVIKNELRQKLKIYLKRFPEEIYFEQSNNNGTGVF
jgi:hypothetical protein